MMCGFFRNILILVDKLLNVCLMGSPHKTVSMRLSFCIFCQYVKPRYFWVYLFGVFVDFLFHNKLYCLEENHVYNSYEAEEMLCRPLWRWYEVVDQHGFDKLKKKMSQVRFYGREG